MSESVGYGFVPCKFDDPERTHVWCQNAKFWLERCHVDSKIGSNVSQTWSHRKPVKIPDGWELVPENELDTIPKDNDWEYLCVRYGTWMKLQNSSEDRSAKYWREREHAYTKDTPAFIRRKTEKPNVSALDWTKSLQTRSGLKARLIGTLNARQRTHVVAIMGEDGFEYESRYYPNGWKTEHAENRKDIINVPERIKREVWVNVYERLGHIAGYTERRIADNNATTNRLACVKVTIECAVGDGLAPH